MCASLVFPAIGVSCAVDCASGFRFVGLIALIVLEPVILCVFALLFAVPVVDMLVAAQKDGASTIGAKVLAIYLAVAVWSLAGFLLALVYFISGSDSGVPEFSIPLCALLPAVVWQAPIYRAVNLDRIGAWTGRYRWALVRELERSASRLASFGTGRVDDADLAAVVKVEIDSYKVVSEKAVKAEGGRKDSQGQLDRREISLRRLVENAVGGRYRLPRVESGSETSRARVIRGSVQAGPFRIPLEMEIS